MMNQPTYVSQTNTFKNEFRIDCSYLRTKSGILKILQQIFIVIASISYWISIVNYSNPDDRAALHYHRSSKTLFLDIGFGIFFYFIILGAILLPIVHVLMWSYLLHKVEKYSKYPWYTIEYATCGGGTVLCLIAMICGICRFYIEIKTSIFVVLIFTLAAGISFLLNIFLVCNKQRMKLPLQKAVPLL